MFCFANNLSIVWTEEFFRRQKVRILIDNCFEPQPLPRPGLNILLNGLPEDPRLPGGRDDQPQWLLGLALALALAWTSSRILS